MKVSFELGIRTHCTGCGTVLNIRNLLEPTVWDRAEHMIWILKQAKDRLERFDCPQCKTKTTHLDWFEEPPKPKKKRSKKLSNSTQSGSDT